VDPAVQLTDQPYVFVNGNPLNATDPLGLCWGWCTFTDVGHAVSNVGHAVIHVADVVRHGFAAAANNGVVLGVVGLTLDGASLALDTASAITDEPVLSGLSTFVGAAGIAVSAKSCAKHDGFGCAGVAIGGVSVGVSLIEDGPASAALKSVLKGVGIQSDGLAVTLDASSAVVKTLNNKKR
jgi:hypothetical protein